MVALKIGADRQLRRVPAQQRWVWVAGVLSLAAQSPIRGHLLLVDADHVTAKDIAEEASVGIGVARKALASFRTLELVQMDDELACEFVPNFLLYNPMPAAESREGERLRKREQRARQRIAKRAVEGALG
ncbi:MAG TPA: hypothetical protein VGC63_04800 [Solirubrobacterales bacterium]